MTKTKLENNRKPLCLHPFTFMELVFRQNTGIELFTELVFQQITWIDWDMALP